MPHLFRILVAEDDPADVHLMKHAFAKSGVETAVTFVRDGREAIAYLRQTRSSRAGTTQSKPTLLLLDLRMPRLDGLQVVRWLRRYEEFRELLVVIFTASEDPEDMRKAYELGADSYIIKPTQPQEMMELLLDMRKQWLQIHATPECGSLR